MKIFLLSVYLMFGAGCMIELDDRHPEKDLSWHQVLVGAAIWPVWAGMIVTAMLHDEAGL